MVDANEVVSFPVVDVVGGLVGLVPLVVVVVVGGELVLTDVVGLVAGSVVSAKVQHATIMSEVVTIIGDGTTFGCLNRSWLRDCSCSTWPRSGCCGCDRLWFFNLVVIVAIYDLRRNGNLAERSFKFLVLAGQESP